MFQIVLILVMSFFADLLLETTAVGEKFAMSETHVISMWFFKTMKSPWSFGDCSISHHGWWIWREAFRACAARSGQGAGENEAAAASRRGEACDISPKSAMI